MKFKIPSVFLILVILLSSDAVLGLGRKSDNAHLFIDSLDHKQQEGKWWLLVHASRKLMMLGDAFLDYDDAGPNPRHDPRGRRGGGASKNP